MRGILLWMYVTNQPVLQYAFLESVSWHEILAQDPSLVLYAIPFGNVDLETVAVRLAYQNQPTTEQKKLAIVANQWTIKQPDSLKLVLSTYSLKISPIQNLVTQWHGHVFGVRKYDEGKFLAFVQRRFGDRHSYLRDGPGRYKFSSIEDFLQLRMEVTNGHENMPKFRLHNAAVRRMQDSFRDGVSSTH